MKLQILKCHGSGNDFILINEYKEKFFSEKERVILTKGLCDRKGKLGADGVLFFQDTDNADGKMRMFNPDGSEAEMCGNGLRCIGRFACETLNKDSVLIKTLKGVSRVIKDSPIHKGVKTYQAQLSTISLNTKDVPIGINEQSLINQHLPTLWPHLRFTAISMPNPHLVSIVESFSDAELEKIGEIANKVTNLLPNGINVNFCQILDNHSIFVRTYERGVGLTPSCGSGMSASSLVACLLKKIPFGKTIDVYNRGGLVRCKPIVSDQDQYAVFLSGNATFMFNTTIVFEFPNVSPLTAYFESVFLEEIQNYGRLIEYSEQRLRQLIYN